jgi:hypothetical protein
VSVGHNDSADDDALSIEEQVYQRSIQLQLGEAAEKRFKPWHKPRKHYLRVHQWCAEIAALVRELRLDDGDSLRYLGMPGEDLLDVRTLHGVCERAKVKLLYLGFDSTADNDGTYELNLSRHEVSSLGFIDPFSKILKDRVERISIDKSVTRAQFVEMAPYDVINLDLCDSVAAGTGPGSYYDALVSICNLQLRAGRVKPWLLFIATRATRAQIDGESKAKLLTCVRENMMRNVAFEECVKQKLSLSVRDIEDEISGLAQLEHSRLVRAFGLGLGKWLLKVSMSSAPLVMVQLLASYSYRVEIAEPDMLSLAFSFEPVIEDRVDATGLGLTVTPQQPMADEETLGIELAERLSAVKDIDQMLANDPTLMAKVTEQSAKVLEGARYSRESYLAWVEENPTFGDPTRPDRGRVEASEFT